MTRSSRLLAVGLAVLTLALVVMLLSLRSRPEPIVVADGAAPDVAAEETVETTPAGAVGALAEGEARLPVPLEVPEGHEAVAVTATFDKAVAALPAPGDAVNVYGVFTNGLPPELVDGSAETGADEVLTLSGEGGAARVLAGVEVLGVSGVQPEAGGGSVTLVLAVEPGDALKVIHLAGTEQVWFSLVADGQESPVGVGVTRATVLD